MHDAIWEIPEHVGWQIFHSYEQSQGNARKFMHKITKNKQSNHVFESFRDIVIPDDVESDTLRI